MTPRYKNENEGIEEKLYTDRQFKAAISQVARTLQTQLTQEVSTRLIAAQPVEKKTSIKEWIAIALSLIMWFASITYMAGVLGQRVTELENSAAQLRQDVMSKEQLQEKFEGISLRLKALEEMQKSLITAK